MADFQPAIENAMSFEDPQHSGKVTEDAGGRTRFGIAEKFHPDLPAEFFSAGKDEALAVAESFLEHRYWDKAGLAQIEDQAVANKLFDMAVNMGLHQAAIYAQRAANAAVQISGAQRPGLPAASTKMACLEQRPSPPSTHWMQRSTWNFYANFRLPTIATSPA